MRKDIAFHFVAIAVGISLFGIGERVKTLPDAITTLLFIVGGILFIVGMLGFTGIWDKLFGKNIKTTSSSTKTIPQEIKFFYNPKNNTISAVAIEQTQKLEKGNLFPIKQIKHDKRPSVWASLFWVLLFSFILFASLQQIYLWVSREMPIQLNLSTIMFPIIFLFPLYALIEMFYTKRKYYRLNRSSKVKDADFVVDGNINNIFDNCRRIFLAMNTTDIRMKPLKLLKARHEQSKIIVEIRRRHDLKISVYVVSDALHIWDRHDGDSNQKNIDTFTKLIYHSIWELNQETNK